MSLSTPRDEYEIKALAALREKSEEFLGDFGKDDHFLLRFLRARDLNVDAAAIMLKKYIDWRTTNEDLQVINTPGWKAPDVIVENVKYKVTGFDGEGRPVVWVPMGRWEMRQHIQNGLMQDVFRFFYHFLDEIVQVIDSQREKTGATQAVMILDMEELWFRKVAHYPSIQACLRFFKEFEAYYPEILYAVYIVNAHSIFTYIFNIVKHILTARTISKVKIYSRDERSWKLVLLSNIPPQSFPIEYGGEGPPVLT